APQPGLQSLESSCAERHVGSKKQDADFHDGCNLAGLYQAQDWLQRRWNRKWRSPRRRHLFPERWLFRPLASQVLAFRGYAILDGRHAPSFASHTEFADADHSIPRAIRLQ